jgi:peptidoglycan/LPS O-acetylase OafA/YrhL
MKYRREVDGLRALAVLPVIFFHAGFEIFCGGFIGVDIFFVISGYLITTIILDEKEANKFSIVNFYERRARRILPALFLVMAICLPFAWVWLMPSDLKEFAQSLTAVTVFSSNILFWKTSGYFESAAELKPLLHTWSLAVEEQYYLIFPLFIIATWRYGMKWMVTALSVVALISISLAQWGATHMPLATFFMLPTRFWELLIGSFIAFYFASKQFSPHSLKLSNVASLVGLLTILYAMFKFDKFTPFPSLYALIPALGSALIVVFATPQTIIGKLLGYKFFVGVG